MKSFAAGFSARSAFMDCVILTLPLGGKMRIFFKTLGLGTLFLLLELVAYVVITSIFGRIRVEHDHATGVSALIVGLIEATIYNVWFWLLCAVAYGAAFWLTKRYAR
jgi:hypothetical protein